MSNGTNVIVGRFSSHQVGTGTGSGGGGDYRGSGGGGGFDDILQRVTRLEVTLENVDKRMAEAVTDIKVLLQGMPRIDTKLDSKANSSDVAAINAKLDDKPSTWKVVTIVLVIGGLLFGASFMRYVFPEHGMPQNTDRPLKGEHSTPAPSP